MVETVAVPRGQLEAIYRTLGSILQQPDTTTQPGPTAPVSSSPSPGMPDGFGPFCLELMAGRLKNAKLPAQAKLEEFYNATGGDLDVVAAIIDYVVEREQKQGAPIGSPIPYALVTLRRDPDRFIQREEVSQPTEVIGLPQRPTLEQVQGMINEGAL